MRVGIVGIQHESNTFLPRPTTLADFERDRLLIGEAIRAEYAGGHHEVSGFLQGLEAERLEAVPLFFTQATPGGMVSAETLEELVARLFAALDRAGPLDGLLAAPHGAGVSERHRDMDGYWLNRLRERIGPAVPLVATLDLHANLSERMAAACDALIAYRSNPHLDQRARGREAARLLARTLRGEVRPTMAVALPPVAINIERQHTSSSPCRELYALADEMLAQPGVLSNSILLGFPYADVEEMGSGFAVVTDNDPEQARALADELAAYLWEHRQDFVGRLVGIEAAVEEAARGAGPVCLLDMGDNVGGGSPGDGTFLLQALDRPGMPRSFVCIYDPQAVERSQQAGVGSIVELLIGGKTDDQHGAAHPATVTVRSLHDGRFEEREPRHGGQARYNMGRTAIVETAHGVTVMLTSRRTVPFSLNQLTSCGLDPRSFQILVAKGVHAPAAAYEPVCTRLIRVDTPGCTRADMTKLPYHHRRRPLFPFETAAER